MISNIDEKLAELRKLPQIEVIGNSPTFEIHVSIDQGDWWLAPLGFSVLGYMFLGASQLSPPTPLNHLWWFAPLLTFPIALLNKAWSKNTRHSIRVDHDDVVYERHRRGKLVEQLKGSVQKISVYFHSSRGGTGWYQVYLGSEIDEYFNLPEEGYPGHAWRILLDIFEAQEKHNMDEGTVPRPEVTKFTIPRLLKLVLIAVVVFAVLLGGISLLAYIKTS